MTLLYALEALPVMDKWDCVERQNERHENHST